MDLHNKNGQPSMEEILASIRRIIAEEPTAANPVIDLHARYRSQKAEEQDESNDFELPSIFRPAAPTPERQPLFGRLTDAIRNASSGSDSKNGARRSDDAEPQERYRGALRDAGTILALSNGQGSLDSAPAGTHHSTSDQERYRGALRDAATGNASLTSALSSLKLTRGGEATPLPDRLEPEAVSVAPLMPDVVPLPVAPAPVAQAPVSHAPVSPAPAAAPVSAAASSIEDVRRVMVPFRDMRMSRMSTPEAPSAPAGTTAALESFMQAPMPSFTEPVSPQNDFPAPPSFDDGLSLDDMHRFASVVEPPAHRPPPPPPPVAMPTLVAAPHAAPVPVEATPADGGIEDTTADLLRPMLRQWLSENMPRMVEKALSIELAESVRTNKKFTG